MKKLLTIFIGCILYVGNVSAEWSEWGDITKFGLSSGVFFFGELSNLTSENNLKICDSNPEKVEFTFLVGKPSTEHLASIILAAEMNNRKIRVFVTGDCLGNLVEINGVEIHES